MSPLDSTEASSSATAGGEWKHWTWSGYNACCYWVHYSRCLLLSLDSTRWHPPRQGQQNPGYMAGVESLTLMAEKGLKLFHKNLKIRKVIQFPLNIFDNSQIHSYYIIQFWDRQLKITSNSFLWNQICFFFKYSFFSNNAKQQNKPQKKVVSTMLVSYLPPLCLHSKSSSSLWEITWLY